MGMGAFVAMKRKQWGQPDQVGKKEEQAEDLSLPQIFYESSGIKQSSSNTKWRQDCKFYSQTLDFNSLRLKNCFQNPVENPYRVCSYSLHRHPGTDAAATSAVILALPLPS